MPRRRLRELVTTNPFELFISSACVVSGTPAVVGAISPASITAVLPEWTQVGWGIVLTVGGIAGVVGLISRVIRSTWFLWGLECERVGMILMATAATCYAIAIALSVDISRSLFAIGIQVGLALASVGRSYAIWRMTSKIKGGFGAD